MDEAIDPITGIVGGKKPASSNNEDDHSKGRQENNDDDGDSVTEEMEEVPLPAKIGKSPTGTKLDAPPVSSTDKEETETTIPSSSKRKPMEPLEVETATTAEITEEELYDDMESLLHSSDDSSPDATTTTQKSKAKQSGGGGLRMKSTQTYCCGHVKPQPVGNMKILLPERFEQSGWGVLGPHWFGPVCVWIILLVATRFTVKGALTIGPISTLICLAFLGYCTYLLFNVSFRDPGICLAKEIPDDVPQEQRRQWRWCDFCSVYQPPDGAHCPDCNVCIAGYDHHCVWMGTCIGKRNYRQFVKFNMMWLYYLLYAIFWLSIFGPMLFHEHHYKGAMKQAKHMNATNNNAVGDDGGGCRTI